MVDGDTKTLREYGNDMRTLATKSERIWWSMGDDSSILCADILFHTGGFDFGEFPNNTFLRHGWSPSLFHNMSLTLCCSDRKWDPRQLDRVDNKTHAQKSSIIMPWRSELHLCSGFSQCPIYFWPASVLELIYPWLRNLLCKDWILD